MTAQIVERAALRFTPAGLPALDLSLRHASEVVQLGSPRKVSLEIRANAVGDVTDVLLAAELGVEHVFEGFLGPARNGRGVVLHVQTVRLTRGQHHATTTR